MMFGRIVWIALALLGCHPPSGDVAPARVVMQTAVSPELARVLVEQGIEACAATLPSCQYQRSQAAEMTGVQISVDDCRVIGSVPDGGIRDDVPGHPKFPTEKVPRSAGAPGLAIAR
jgi:hypothetical protein